MGKIILILVVIAAIAMFAVLSPMLVQAYHEKNAALSTFNDFSAALVDRNYKVAYAMCSKDFRTTTPVEEFVRQQSLLETNHGRLVRIKRNSFIAEGRGTPARWTARLEATNVYERDEQRFSYWLIRDDNHWQIIGYREKD